MSEATARSPDWDHLFEIAAAQTGRFTTQQAAEAGYSPQLLAHHLGARRMVRVRRGVYRLVHLTLPEAWRKRRLRPTVNWLARVWPALFGRDFVIVGIKHDAQ